VGKAGLSAMVKLDDFDKKLLVHLMEDASQTNTAIARKLNVSDGTVRNRIQRLIELGVLRIVAIVDPWKIGHRHQLISGIEADLDKITEIADALSEYSEVTYVSYTTGPYDLIMVSAFSSEEEMFRFLTEKLAKIKGIRHISSSHVLKAVKQTFRYDQFLKDKEELDMDGQS
jgi:Lrp/AsnC family transcriptional regulator for asnA, asnC and gidA